MSGISRRMLCCAMGTCGQILITGCMENNRSDEDMTTPESVSESHIRAIYIWDYGPVLATDTQARGRFFNQMDQLGVNTVFLSWGALQSASISDRESFIKHSHEQDLQVHALIGTAGENAVTNAEKVVPEILSYNSKHPSSTQFDGMHLDVEPGETDIDMFLDEYRTLLEQLLDDDLIENQKLLISSAVGWWWGNESQRKTSLLVGHDILDYVVIMAYWNTEKEIRKRLSAIVSENDVPYVLAVETQEFAKNTTNKRVSFYDQGYSVLDSVLDNIETSPPTSKFRGIAYHYYQSSISKWNSLKDVQISNKTARPGDKITILVEVLFDDNFPKSSHKSEIIVKIDRGESTQTLSEMIEPPSREVERVSINWTIPSDTELGDYSVRVILNDLVLVDENREAVSRRSNPVELDSINAGTISVRNE